MEFRMPPLLTDTEIEEILAVLPDLTKWANEITAYATDAAVNHGKEWNGFKVVEGRSVRKYKDEAYKGHYFINANSNTPPQIVDRAVKPILDRSEVYSGCYARVSLSFYAFNSNGNKGVACGLGNIQKVRDGEPLGGRTNAADDFATLDDDDFLS